MRTGKNPKLQIKTSGGVEVTKKDPKAHKA